MPAFHPDPEIQALIESCAAHLRGEFVTSGTALTALQRHSDERPAASQLQAVYETACMLCNQGSFSFASGLTLHLVANAPTDPRFTFLAATCMQRLGLHANAAQLFGFSLVHGGDHPATLYRFGESLLAMGDRENAAKALEAAFDLSRGNENSRGVQAMAEHLLATLHRRAKAVPVTGPNF